MDNGRRPRDRHEVALVKMKRHERLMIDGLRGLIGSSLTTRLGTRSRIQLDDLISVGAWIAKEYG